MSPVEEHCKIFQKHLKEYSTKLKIYLQLISKIFKTKSKSKLKSKVFETIKKKFITYLKKIFKTYLKIRKKY